MVTPDEPQVFSDVNEAHWYYEAAVYVAENKLFGGMEDGSFGADIGMSRAMLVTVLHRLAGEPTPGGASDFRDVPPQSWYAEAAAWAGEAGVVEGLSGLFAGDQVITREQFAVMLYRYAQKLGQAPVQGQPSYPDTAQISSWALEAAAYCESRGLMVGRDGGAFAPSAQMTRAEAATVLMRWHKLQK